MRWSPADQQSLPREQHLHRRLAGNFRTHLVMGGKSFVHLASVGVALNRNLFLDFRSQSGVGSSLAILVLSTQGIIRHGRMDGVFISRSRRLLRPFPFESGCRSHEGRRRRSTCVKGVARIEEVGLKQ